MEPLDDAKFSGTKEVAEHLTIEVSNLQPWIDEFVPGAGKIKSVEQFNPDYISSDCAIASRHIVQGVRDNSKKKIKKLHPISLMRLAYNL